MKGEEKNCFPKNYVSCLSTAILITIAQSTLHMHDKLKTQHASLT